MKPIYLVRDYNNSVIMCCDDKEDAQEMVLSLTEEILYLQFCKDINYFGMDANEWFSGLSFSRRVMNNYLGGRNTTEIETEMGYGLLKDVDPYTIRKINMTERG